MRAELGREVRGVAPLVDGRVGRVAEVVEDGDGVTAREERPRDVVPDETDAASDEDAHDARYFDEGNVGPLFAGTLVGAGTPIPW